MNETEKIPKPPTKRGSTMDEFIDAAGKLTDAERATLEDRGYLMPNQDQGSAEENWGYLCSQCGAVAIVFLGARFRQHDGTIGPDLPPGMALNKLPWIQKTSEKFPRSLVSRETPCCPDCRVVLTFEGGTEKFLKPRLVRSLSVHRQTEAENRTQIENHRRSRQRVPVGAPSPSQIRMPS